MKSCIMYYAHTCVTKSFYSPKSMKNIEIFNPKKLQKLFLKWEYLKIFHKIFHFETYKRCSVDYGKNKIRKLEKT